MKQEIIIRGIEDLDRAAAEFLEKIGENTLVAFFAPMGSGKTTFTTAICKALGVTDPVGSPTVAITWTADASASWNGRKTSRSYFRKKRSK